ncbi:hypothetical protein [Methanoculleus chikugoensis]|uniref:hypothetical protein n=1 Tax=Methanoculleus chikugoensis TaxID=118126 RepID=UPI001FB533C1|nr:hypothetical protein [Methanoculleus chikugoensis]
MADLGEGGFDRRRAAIRVKPPPVSFTSSSSRSRLTERCTPRFEPAREWISSTTTHRTVRRFSRNFGEFKRIPRVSGG